MKKLILIGIVFISSCSTPEITPPTPVVTTCNVEKYTEVRTIVYATATQPQTDTGFVENGAKAFYSNDCKDCGKVLPGGSSTSGLNYYQEIRYIAKCK